jgi:TnpA family transposase
MTPHSKLLWTAEWHIRDETYRAGLACLVEAIHAQPFTAIWGDGDTSSSDGQFFRVGGHGEARAEHNARYGSEPGVKFYTHVSDRYAPSLYIPNGRGRGIAGRCPPKSCR